MTISADTLFHFTKNSSSLLSILKNGFYPRFCLEDLTETNSIISAGNDFDEWAVPMVCFCDIPLSKIKEHIDFYGNYGIGLEKSWGKNRGLNPLIYISKDSHLTEIIKNLRGTFLQKIDNNKDHYVEWFELASYFKPVRGKMFKSGVFVEKEFYDEKEWRYVPFLEGQTDMLDIKMYRMTKDEYLDDIQRTNANDTLQTVSNLAFEPNNVKYILVPTTKQAISLANNMKLILKEASSETINLLISKILTCEQIQQDF